MLNYLIVGASSGIGFQLAQNLTKDGHTVYGTYNKKSPENNSFIQFHPLNVMDEKLELDFLPEIIDGIVYCPGSINLKPFPRISPLDFEEDYKLNVSGAIKVIQTVLPKLKKGSCPSIVLFSTIAVQTGLPFHTQVASSKGAIEGLMRALAAELAPTIRVNGIAPSLTDTPLALHLLNTEDKKSAAAKRHPLQRVGTVNDIANIAQFLLSEKAGWITGQLFGVDGGLSTLQV